MFAHQIVVFVGTLLLLVLLVRLLRVLAGPTDAASRRRVIRSVGRDATIVLLAGGSLLAWICYLPQAPAPLLKANSKDLPRTMVTPIAAIPFHAEQNVLWCASFTLAWDALRRDLLAGAPVVLDPPACREEAAALNANPFPKGDLDPASVVAMAGSRESGIEGRIRAAVRGEVDLPPLGPMDFLAFGFLEKDLPFETPFETIDGGLSFGEGEEARRVRAFGLARRSSNPRKEALLAQVRIHLAEADRDDGTFAKFHPDRFVLELLPRGGKDRVLLAQVKPKPTLEETWETVRAAASGAGKPAPPDTVLAVPKLNFDIDHRFPGLCGVTGSFGFLRESRQRTRFRLDETGARLRSVSSMAGTLGVSPTFEFRKPFLVALLQKGATRPYLLLWVGNDELLAPE